MKNSIDYEANALHVPTLDRPIKTANASSFYRQLTRKISYLNRRILNEEILPDPIVKLEKETLRGCGTERNTEKLQPRPLPKPDLLTEILRSEHKITENTCIVKLPKMPFGKHKSYNEEKSFVLKHFVDPEKDMQNQINNDLNEMMKKFRLYRKRKQSNKRNNTGAATSRYQQVYNAYRMEHGTLTCRNEGHTAEGYKNDKEKYVQLIFSDKDKQKRLKKRVNKSMQEQSMDRLAITQHSVSTERSSFFTTKYSALFTRESSRRVPMLNLSFN
jgi:hypothetical protein